MLKWIFGQELHMMSNQVGVNTCRDHNNEHTAIVEG